MPPALGDVDVGANLAAARRRIEAAGGDPGSVRIVAVTKGFGPDAVRAALACGLRDIGENYAQELLAKARALADPSAAPRPPDGADAAGRRAGGVGGAGHGVETGGGHGVETGADTGADTGAGTGADTGADTGAGTGAGTGADTGAGAEHGGVRWHYLGAVQRNKVPALAPVVSLWQSVARAVEGEAIARRRPGAHVLVEVELTGAPGRNGCPPGQVGDLVAELRSLPLAVDGLMAVAPVGPGARAAFRTVRELADGLGLRERSIGMSDDLEAAVAEGSTMVRLGRALFGDRPPGRGDAR